MKIQMSKAWGVGALFAAAAVVIALFMPRADQLSLAYELNRPWADAQLLAPFDVPVYRDEASKQQLIDSIDAHFVPVYRRDNGPLDGLRALIGHTDKLGGADKQLALRALERVYEDGVVDQETADRIASGELSRIKVRGADNTSRELPARKLRSTRRAYLMLDSLVKPRNPALMSVLRAMHIADNLTPNYVADEEETARLRNELLQPVEAAVGIIQKGERIIDRGDIVTPQLYQVLKTYEAEMMKRQRADTSSGFNVAVGQFGFAAVVMAALWLFLRLYRRDWSESLPRAGCLLTVVVAFFVTAALVDTHFPTGLYIVPLAIVPILVVVFYDVATALFTLVVEVTLCAAFATFPFEFVAVELMAGVTAVFSLRELSKRSQLLRTAALVFGAYVLTYVSVELMEVAKLSTFSWRLIGYFAVNMVLTSFAYILIFVLEKLFGFTSVVTLVELSDINNAQLRELSVQCPGTFQHSMAVGNLASAAAHRIGASVQLVRAGALYHDIGKIDNPAFFTENQYGVNPHDALTPQQSAKVIIGHVSDGVKRAERSNLPRVVKDMILQHHGRGTARYFYNTWCNAHPGEAVDAGPFTYPGPNPQTKEASLLMMADTVEAASRALPDHKIETLTAMVNKLVDAQVAEGLHSDSPLSFRDITAIKQAFIDTLRTSFHVRIAYPDKKQ